MTIKQYIYVLQAIGRIPRECSPRIVWKFVWNFGLRNMTNIRRFEKRQKEGKPFFPAFVMISITESCNLACSGCWVSYGGKKKLSAKQLDGIITGSKKKGSYFFGILGGEPLMYSELLEVLSHHPDCYFQLFTNGTLLTDTIAMQLKKLGNITPMISIEGLKEESDARRGKEDVLRRTLDGVRACRKARLIIGAAASIGKSNFNELVNREYIDLLAKEGVHYLWYYIYRPVGAEPKTANALEKDQVLQLRKFIVEQRTTAPLQVVDAYWDDKGNALCPGAVGLSHHISPSGGVEFCPPLQMAKDFINEDGSNVVELFENSDFLAGLRKLTSQTSRGCILLENPALALQFAEQQQAVDTTSRGTVLEEMRKMPVLAGHDMKGEEVAEKNVFYRFIKKNYFFGFGAYG
ncbi:Sporulation killing factor maturation protein SkfB [termite gut metagenome]|uniref:Sporulation killing factor maturation protein SkfB n=1 Tax=termite gut metagenome TaxID=433724 RepID=A0A5J4RGD4_9ZZZZ